MAGASFIVISYAGLRWNISPYWFFLTAGFWVGGLLRIRSAYAAALYFFWLAVPLASFIALGWAHEGEGYRALLPLSTIVLVWINDIFAYLSGSILGRHPMTPRLSPGKTWEGFAGGILFNMLAGYALFHLSGMYSAGVWILSGGLISILAFSGDLFESGLKRSFGVKDTGTLLPGHGGILDRFDSLLFAAPVLWIVLTLVTFFG
jgi:phosphatidate cytidylyltransferase